MIRLKHINDTQMIKLTQKEQNIISIILRNNSMQSSDVYAELTKQEETSLITVKRILSRMVDKNLLKIAGSGRSTNYTVSVFGRIFFEVNANNYISIEPDKRYGLKKYNFELFSSFPREIFADKELKDLNRITSEYQVKIKELSLAIKKKELERLIIELSWKSSKIEGNTYTLLDTEKLILENKEADGKTKEETQMILNHKDAFSFIYQNKSLFQNITPQNIEAVHSLLIKNLNVNKGFRKNPVGITGSSYRPLDNVYQIKEAVEELCFLVSDLSTPYAKALISLLGTSYIQPFEDGNKRTSRLIADALLLAHNCAPLSYRSVNEADYKNATLVFYELNSIIPFKKIFIEQYDFATKNYAIK